MYVFCFGYLWNLKCTAAKKVSNFPFCHLNAKNLITNCSILTAVPSVTSVFSRF